MKKINFLALATAAVAMSVFSSCGDEKDPSELTEESVAVQSTVCGFVQYSYQTSSKKVYDVAPKTVVRVEYTIDAKDAEGKDTKITLYKETKSKADGSYSADIVVPVGKSADVTVSTNFEAESYKADITDATSTGTKTCNFYGLAKDTLQYGQTLVLNVNASEAGSIEEAFYGDAEGK